MNFGQTRVRLVQVGAALAAAALVAGCGNQYRPVVTPVSTNGPAPQPQAYAVVVSAPPPVTKAGVTTIPAGIASIIDYSGDTIMAQATIGLGPIAFTEDETGSIGYTINSDGTMTDFPVSSLLMTKSVTYMTLANGADPVGIFSPSAGLWIADPIAGPIAGPIIGSNAVDVMTGSPVGFKLAIPVAPTPVAVIGLGTIGERNYAISQSNSDTSGMLCNSTPTAQPTGQADAIEISTYTIPTTGKLALGKCPVYAVMSTDGRRLFVLNRGDDTVSVINVTNDTLDSCTPFKNPSNQTVTCHPTLPLSTTAGLAQNSTNTVPTVAGPVYAEYNAATSQLWVANYDGSTVSIIDVSEDEYGNDSPTFGTTYTVPVGKNPASVTVLYDGSRGYTANQSDGTVSIITESSHTIEKTLTVVGHPRTVVSTENSEYGKVYVASPDSPYLTIINAGGTDPDVVDTTVLVEGNIVDVRVSNQSGVSTTGNVNNISRIPGYGQPCNLPLSEFNPATSSNATLANCQAQDKTLLK